MKYDPYLIITKKILDQGTFPYGHHSKPILEELVNQESWEDVQRILQIQVQYSSHSTQPSTIKTLQQHEKTNKRTHPKSSQTISDVEEEE
jgi:hypothetical protein